MLAWLDTLGLGCAKAADHPQEGLSSVTFAHLFMTSCDPNETH
jgi:hypothetical protein